MQIDVKPLVWRTLKDGWRVAVGFGFTYNLHPDHGDDWIAKHNAHHAAHVRSQVTGVRLSEGEARDAADAITAELCSPFVGFHLETQNAMVAAVQAAIAAMGVGQ